MRPDAPGTPDAEAERLAALLEAGTAGPAELSRLEELHRGALAVYTEERPRLLALRAGLEAARHPTAVDYRRARLECARALLAHCRAAARCRATGELPGLGGVPGAERGAAAAAGYVLRCCDQFPHSARLRDYRALRDALRAGDAAGLRAAYAAAGLCDGPGPADAAALFAALPAYLDWALCRGGLADEVGRQFGAPPAPADVVAAAVDALLPEAAACADLLTAREAALLQHRLVALQPAARTRDEVRRLLVDRLRVDPRLVRLEVAGGRYYMFGTARRAFAQALGAPAALDAFLGGEFARELERHAAVAAERGCELAYDRDAHAQCLACLLVECCMEPDVCRLALRCQCLGLLGLQGPALVGQAVQLVMAAE